MSAVMIHENNFRQEVLESTKPVLVDFFAQWCGPCKMVGPILEEISDERSDIKVCKIDVDAEHSLAAAYKVMSIPTMMIFKNGQMVKRMVGAMTKDEILAQLP